MTIDLFCRMQFNDTDKLKRPVGFIDPQRIFQPNMVVNIRTDDPRIKGKSKKDKARVIKEATKTKGLEMSTYIGRAILEMQDKDYIFAPYNFK